MARLTTDWTDRHAAVAPALVTAAVAGLVVAAEPTAYWPVSAVAVVGTALAALRLDAFGGIVAGLVAAAAVVAVKQVTNGWTPDAFGASLAVTVALLATGWVTGITSGRLRDRAPKDLAASSVTGSVTGPAYGSLGLITADVAEARLDEEVARAWRHRRPLSLVLLRTRVTDEALGEGARRSAYRSVARLVETLLRDTDVPFALSREEVGAVLPETGGDEAWEVVGPLVEAVTGATFTDREDGERRSFTDCADLQVGLVTLTREHESAADLLAAVHRAVVTDEADAAPAPVTG